MKAVAAFPGPREVRVIELEAPRISEPDQVMVRMLDVGVCGTDKEICSFEYGKAPELILGRPAGLKSVISFGAPA